MKKIFTAILLIFICHDVFSQIKVKENSFHQIEGFVMLDKNDHYDDNNRPMALIKIATENIKAEERRKFIFKGNMATYFDVHFEPGEIWLYLSTEATFIEIIHDDFGKTEFVLPYDLKGFCGYEMVVQYVPLTPLQERVQKKYHLIVKADQPDATIYIDEEALSVGEASKLVDEGTTHTYKIECKLYHAESGSVTVNEKTVIEKSLRPNFGYINISTSPEQGAKVFVDGDYIGESPITTDKLASGTHTVRVMKDMYKMKEQSFTVTDGQTTNANVTMEANFVTLTVNTDADAEIYVDEEYKGKGQWTGRISEGSHIFEARKQNHRPTKKTLDLVVGENKTITLEAPKPINGSIEINSSPMEANIYIDGKSYGTTPNYINEIIIGTHELKLEKQGCTTITKSITIKEGETLSVNEKLQTGKEISISTDKTSDEIYLDFDNKSTQSPQNFTPRKDNLDKYLYRGINFITMNAAYSVAPQMSYGLTYGRVKKFGWFVSAMTNFEFMFEANDWEGLNYIEEAVFSGKSSKTRLSLTGGLLLRLGGPIYMKLGAGYGVRVKCWELSGEWYEYAPDTYRGVDLTAGLMFNTKGCAISADVVTTHFKTLEFKLGIGINWN